MNVKVVLEDEPRKENLINILRRGNRLLREKEKREEASPAPAKK